MIDTVLLCDHTNDSLSGQPMDSSTFGSVEEQLQFVEESLRNSRLERFWIQSIILRFRLSRDRGWMDLVNIDNFQLLFS